MAYIGKSPSGTGVRQRYYFTATGGETSLSGTDDNGLTLSYSDGAYVDVLLNGIELVAGTDYNTSTANTIAGLAALAASDVVTVTVYDIFTVADTVSAKDGGTFSDNVTFNGNINAGTIKDATGTNTALEINSSGFLLPKKPIVFAVSALNLDQSISSNGTVVQWATSTDVDTGSYWDSTNHRFTPQVAGWYLFGALIRFSATTINSQISFNFYKTGSRYASTQLQFSSDVITNSNYPVAPVLIDLNGSTDYVDIRWDGDEAIVAHDSTAYQSRFWGVLQYAT